MGFSSSVRGCDFGVLFLRHCLAVRKGRALKRRGFEEGGVEERI